MCQQKAVLDESLVAKVWDFYYDNDPYGAGDDLNNPILLSSYEGMRIAGTNHVSQLLEAEGGSSFVAKQICDTIVAFPDLQGMRKYLHLVRCLKGTRKRRFARLHPKGGTPHDA